MYKKTKLKYNTENLIGLGRRVHTIQEELPQEKTGLSLLIPKGLKTDGASVPKFFILMFLCVGFLIEHFYSLPTWLVVTLVIIGFLGLVIENNAIFQKPAFIHDYNYQYAYLFSFSSKLSFDWCFFKDMLVKCSEVWHRDNNKIRAKFEVLILLWVAVVYFLGVLFFGWFTYYNYYKKKYIN